MDTDDALRQLKGIGDFTEVYHDSTFRCWRKTSAGYSQEIIVTISDAGPDVECRYRCVAEPAEHDQGTECQRPIAGNLHSTLQEAVGNLVAHLRELDGK